MIVQRHITIADEALADVCRRYHVRELALFGSVLRDDFREDSDIDVLVEFEPGAPIACSISWPFSMSWPGCLAVRSISWRRMDSNLCFESRCCGPRKSSMGYEHRQSARPSARTFLAGTV